ncbi:MAG: VCBS repeat-containing protein [Phycisphaerae bacterium]
MSVAEPPRPATPPALSTQSARRGPRAIARPRRRHALLALALAAPLLAIDGCGTSGGGATFPKSTAWMPFSVTSSVNVRPTAVAIAEFNGDGRADVVAAFNGNGGQQPAIVLLIQSIVGPNITFTRVPLAQSPQLAGVSSLAIGDLNADGRLDIVAAANGRLIFLRSPADPTQAAGWAAFVIDHSDDAGLGQYRDVAIAQVDLVNGPDIVAANETGNRISFFPAPPVVVNGAGWTRFDIDAATRAGAFGIALGDLNGDGRIDIVSSAAGEAAARLAWYRNPGGTSQTPWSKFTIGNLPHATRIALDDLDRDGRSDLVAINPGALSMPGANDGIQVGWYRRPADPTTPWDGFLLAQYNAATPTDVAIRDVDANGNKDVIVSTRSPGTLRWFTRRQNIQAQWIENNLRDLSDDAVQIASDDIDIDARPDVVAALQAASDANDSVAWYLNPE